VGGRLAAPMAKRSSAKLNLLAHLEEAMRTGMLIHPDALAVLGQIELGADRTKDMRNKHQRRAADLF